MQLSFSKQAPKGEFKILIPYVIDLDKGITITLNQYLAYKDFNSRWVRKNLIELVFILAAFFRKRSS